ncbi:hypothetical protein BS47DRAFT_1336752 [Hydnum rufescens UP504]|uniref:Mob1/phocein n=1 Tax=Hydnum rufescens UP504 TaxID=1448309 RepID=A0A9P6B8D3_9AGAM|nr:hypothetical protein BS47DRAFT_1336752 [Hydnum rufescens UP504]
MAAYARLSKGSRLQDAFPVPSPFPTLTSLDSAFQLQEYISLLIRLDIHDVKRIITIPGKNDDNESKSESGSSSDVSGLSGGSNDDEKAADEHCWIYEQLRRVAQDLAYPLLSTLQLECNRTTCPEMKADEWLYLCVAHGGGGAMEQCCAIDYIVHTLDSATALLNSPKAFPSRISIPVASRRHFVSIARRLSRIFAHAYYHHREAFEHCEAESSLYSRFYLLCRKFALVPEEFLIPPPSPSNKSTTVHLPSASSSGPHAPSASSVIDDASDPDFDRGVSHFVPRPDRPDAPDEENRHQSNGDDDRMAGHSRTDTMFLSSESLEMALNAEKAKWDQNSLSHPSHKDDNEDDDDEEDEDDDDDDGYDIVEGLSRGGPMVDDEDERDVVVDEMDGDGVGLSPIDGPRSPHHLPRDEENYSEATDEAAALPSLTSSLSLQDEPSRSPGLEPRRSPRRKDTIRQSSISPILPIRPELSPDASDASDTLLPAVAHRTVPGPNTVLLRSPMDLAADGLSAVAPAGPALGLEPLGALYGGSIYHTQGVEEEAMEEVDLTDARSSDDEDGSQHVKA